MKTTVVTMALLGLLFAGCSKDETKDLAPAGQSTINGITRSESDLSGLYRVQKYTKGGIDSYDDMKHLKLYLFKDGLKASTVVGRTVSNGEYRYDSREKLIKFEISGNTQTNTLGTHVWKVSKENGLLILNSTEDELSLWLLKNDPTVPLEPVR